MNSFGHSFRLTTFGESHGPALGGIIDGMPAGIRIDLEAVQHELDRRRPGQSAIVTQRSEADRVEILSGLLDGVTTGTPIGFEIRNTSQRSADYEEMRHTFRPSHADYTYQAKYGIRDHRGGGRASARETAARVVGGAFARQLLALHGITITAYTARVGSVTLGERYPQVDAAVIESNDVRCPDAETAERMRRLILEVKGRGDTVGGIVECQVTGVPAGLGNPLADKLQASLAGAMLTIPAAKGFDYGMGFDGAEGLGSELIDLFTTDADGRITTLTNHSGGIQGGISNGMPLTFRVAFKPVATLLREVATVTDRGEATTLHARGRHDACVVPRAVPVVEAMAAIVLADAWLQR
ncbi:MAG: chorismate synthase [Bacteroidales bacterium]|nr:chorismate synthase [Bacteroidales bacterium]